MAIKQMEMDVIQNVKLNQDFNAKGEMNIKETYVETQFHQKQL